MAKIGTVEGTLKLRDEFTGPLTRASTQLQQTGTRAAAAGKSIGGMLLPIAAVAGGLGLLASKLQALGTEIIAAADAQDRSERALAATLESTGNAAGFALDELKEYAAGLQTLTGVGDEAILTMQSMLGTFTNLSDDVFKRASVSVIDVATKMNDGMLPSIQQMRAATIQLGKALNDPIANMGALSRTGIQFSTSQKAVIKDLADTGRLAEAQGIILEELERQFGGAAAAARDTFGGSQIAARGAVNDLREALGEGLLPALKNVNNAIEDLARNDDTIRFFRELGAGLGVVADELVRIKALIPTGGGGGNFFAGLVHVPLVGELAKLISKLRELGAESLEAAEQAEFLAAGYEMLMGTGEPLAKTLDDIADAAGDAAAETENLAAALEVTGKAAQIADTNLDALLKTMGEAGTEMRRAADAASEFGEEFGEFAIEGILADLEMIPKELPSIFDGMWDGMTEAAGLAFVQMADDMVTALLNGVDDVGKLMEAAFTRLGGSLGNRIGENIAKGMEGTLATLLPGIGGIIGSILGNVVGDLLGGLFGGGGGDQARGTFGAEGFDVTRGGTEAFDQYRDAFQQIQDTLREVEEITGATVQSLAEIEVRINDAGEFIASINGSLVGTFSSMTDAINAALSRAILSANFTGLGADFATVLQNSVGLPIEQVLSNLQFASDIARAAMDPLKLQLLDISRKYEEQRIRALELGLSLEMLNQAMATELASIRASITGEALSEAQIRRQRANVFNQFIMAEQRRIEAEIALKQAELDAMRTATGAMGSAIFALVGVIGDAARALGAQVVALEQTLRNLPNLILPGEIKIAGIKGPSRIDIPAPSGGRKGGGVTLPPASSSRNKALELQRVMDAIGNLRTSTLDSFTQALVGVQNQFRDMIRQMMDAGVSIGRIADLYQDAIDKLVSQALEPLEDFLNSLLTGPLSALSPGEQVGAARSIYDEIARAVEAGDLSLTGDLAAAAREYLELVRQTDPSEFPRVLREMQERLGDIIDDPNVIFKSFEELMVEATNRVSENVVANTVANLEGLSGLGLKVAETADNIIAGSGRGAKEAADEIIRELSAATFDLLDSNHDGLLSLEEVLGVISETEFDLRDINQDGFLDLIEATADLPGMLTEALGAPGSPFYPFAQKDPFDEILDGFDDGVERYIHATVPILEDIKRHTSESADGLVQATRNLDGVAGKLERIGAGV